jgi:hypothetical protein
MECRLRFTTLVLFAIVLHSAHAQWWNLFGSGEKDDAPKPADADKKGDSENPAKDSIDSKDTREEVGAEHPAKDGIGIEEPGNGMEEVLDLVKDKGKVRNSTEALKKASEGPLASTQGWVQKAQIVLMNTKELQQKAGKMLTQLENAHRRLRSELQYKENGVKTLEDAGKDFKTPEAADQASQNFGTEPEELFTSASDDSASETTVKNSIASEASDGSASQASHGSA